MCIIRYALCVFFDSRKVTKESLVESSSNITESLMSISRMMAEKVKQSEDAIGILGKESTLSTSLCFLNQGFILSLKDKSCIAL